MVLIFEQNHSLYPIKTIVIITHLCSETAIFGPLNATPAPEINPILKNKACCSILLKELNYTAHREDLMGCTVNNLVKF
jgi:hypothetical protein